MRPLLRLYSCGSNAGGQLGLGHEEDVRMLMPTSISPGPGLSSPFPPPAHTVAHLAAGANHAVCVVQADAPDRNNIQVWIAGRRGSGTAHPFLRWGSPSQFAPLTPGDISRLLSLAGYSPNQEEETHQANWVPIHVACAWDTTFIALRDADGCGDRSDILLALSTLDEVQRGLVGPVASDSDVSNLRTSCPSFISRVVPLELALNAKERLMPVKIHSLCAGPRHALAHISLSFDLSRPAARSAHHVIGWGAARHGQLGPLNNTLLACSASYNQEKRTVIPDEGQETACAPPFRAQRLKSKRRPCSGPQSLHLWWEDENQEGIDGQVQLSAGQVHTLLLLPGREIAALGHNAAGQTSVPNLRSEPLPQSPSSSTISPPESSSPSMTMEKRCFSPSIVSVGTCWKTSAVLVRNAQKGDQVHTFGTGAHGQLGSRSAARSFSRGEEVCLSQADLSPNTRVQKLQCGSEHILLLVSQTEHHPVGNQPSSVRGKNFPYILAWGWNEHGNLGLGDEPPSLFNSQALSEKEGQTEGEREVGDGPNSTEMDLQPGTRPDRWEPTEMPLPPEMEPLDVWAGCGTTYVLARVQKPCKLSQRSKLLAPFKGGIETNQASQAEQVNPLAGAADLKVRGARDQDFDLLAACTFFPKVELHAHLHGSLRRRTVARWAAAEGLDGTHAHIDDTDDRTLSGMFAVFDLLHVAVGGSAEEVVRDATREVLQDMAQDGVVYVELRTTPRILPGSLDEWSYLSAVARGLRDFDRLQDTWLGAPHTSSGFTTGSEATAAPHVRRLSAKLLLSINRSHSLNAAERVVNLVLQAQALLPPHPCAGLVIGLDVSGDPTKGSFVSLLPALQRARKAGIKITLHMGEVGYPTGRSLASGQRAKREGQPRSRDGETSQDLCAFGAGDTDAMLAFAPERVGHAIFLSERQWSELCTKQIFTEVCLTSNVRTQSVDSYVTHHVAAFLGLEPWVQGNEDGHEDEGQRNYPGTRSKGSIPPPCALATDDTAVFGSSLSQEYALLLETFPSLSLAVLETMNCAALRAAFLPEEEKAALSRLLDGALRDIGA